MIGKCFLVALIFIMIMTNETLICQQNNFNAGIIVGLNFSELEGNSITDYVGLNAGFLGSVKLSKRFQLGTEILFSQNGEYILPEFYPQADYGKIRLNHVEVPIHFDWLINIIKGNKHQEWNLNIGIAYARLLNYHAEDFAGNDLSDEVVFDRRGGFLLQFGNTYAFTKNIALNLKASLPFRAGSGWTLAGRLIYFI